MRRAPRIARLVVACAALAALILLGRQAGGYVLGFAAWVQGLGAWGPVVFIAGYVLATVAFVPGVVLTLAAGVIFGLVRGASVLLAAGVQTPQQLSALHRRLQRWAPFSRRVTLATQLAVVAVGLVAVARA